MAATKKTQAVEEILEEVQVPQEGEMDATTFAAYREKELAKQTEARLATQASLSEPFSQDVERELKKGGTYLTYIPVSEVINRLNKVLGYDGWSYEIVKCDRDAHDPEFIVAHVRMTVYQRADRYVSVVRDGFGGQKIKRTKAGDIVDLGDEFKGAVSDALKKAAQSLGVGLYLARSEEALLSDEVSATPAQAQQVAQPQTPAPDVSPLYESFISLRKSLDETGVESIRKFWTEFSGGRSVPKAHEFTDDELEALIGECVRLNFAGSFVSNESAG